MRKLLCKLFYLTLNEDHHRLHMRNLDLSIKVKKLEHEIKYLKAEISMLKHE